MNNKNNNMRSRIELIQLLQDVLDIVNNNQEDDDDDDDDESEDC